jgi:hypothetical protein
VIAVPVDDADEIDGGRSSVSSRIGHVASRSLFQEILQMKYSGVHSRRSSSAWNMHRVESRVARGSLLGMRELLANLSDHQYY